jgi:hypothetical protein
LSMEIIVSDVLKLRDRLHACGWCVLFEEHH